MRREGSDPRHAQLKHEPPGALYKSPPGECLPISFQGLGKLKTKNIPPPFNNPRRAANGKCYSEANWGQLSVGTPWLYTAKR